MFKKLKDKLTEEVKIPSQKFTQSMQQLAQVGRMTFDENNDLLMITLSKDCAHVIIIIRVFLHHIFNC